MCPYKNSYANFHSSFICRNSNWKQLKCPPTGKQIYKLLYNHISEYNATRKRNELLTYVTTWINLKIFTQSERSQAHTENDCMFVRGGGSGKGRGKLWGVTDVLLTWIAVIGSLCLFVLEHIQSHALNSCRSVPANNTPMKLIKK